LNATLAGLVLQRQRRQAVCGLDLSEVTRDGKVRSC
jgi:hypothetical protein